MNNIYFIIINYNYFLMNTISDIADIGIVNVPLLLLHLIPSTTLQNAFFLWNVDVILINKLTNIY